MVGGRPQMHYDLLEVVLLLDHPVSFLYLVAVSGLPHVVIGHYALHRLPRELFRTQHKGYMRHRSHSTGIYET